LSGAAAGPLSTPVWLGVPLLACVAASVLLALPLKVYGLQPPEPVFALVPTFAWAMIRPSFLPSLALFVLGLFLDLLWGGPLGLWPLCLLVAYGAVLITRRFLSGQGFLALWGWYGLACLVGLGVGYGLMTLKAGSLPNLVALFWQWLASAALFPFAWRLIERYEDADVRFR
jgi:rod shape-determining protein MreD